MASRTALVVNKSPRLPSVSSYSSSANAPIAATNMSAPDDAPSSFLMEEDADVVMARNKREQQPSARTLNTAFYIL